MRETTAMAAIVASDVWRNYRRLLACITLRALILVATTVAAAEIDITAPGSVAFGTSVKVLPNGNIVVTDPNGPTANIGTVYLYTPAGIRISSFTGSSPNDHVGSGGIAVLADGNFVVVSPHWTNGTAANAGAVTWVNGSNGLNGVVSSDNSLVGSSANDQVGYVSDPFIPPYDSAADYSIVALENGNYLVFSPNWNNAAATQTGAVTFAKGASGIAGAVSASNSLIGTHSGDQVGSGGYAELSNGNVVLASPLWSSAIASQVGAVTWMSGTQGALGALSASNSLVGLTANDQVGSAGITPLSNGNYVIGSPNWSNGSIASVGAATWANGNAATSGVVSPANSLVGSTANDQVGLYGATALTNGNYVVASPFWSNGAAANAGAATWGNGSVGAAGVVSVANSLVGSVSNDMVGDGGISALSNGNYVISSSGWSNGAASVVGAITWANGSTGIAGAVSPANSLVGTTANDEIGSLGVYALTNGNYVVCSPYWNNGGVTLAGAVTWADGSVGIRGPVTATNSLVGTTSGDRLGYDGAYALNNGNYVVASYAWSNAGVSNAGAVTWANGTTGITGQVSSANSLVGSRANDAVGGGFVTPLANGNYVVSSPNWANGTATNAGAVTWASGTAGRVGPVSAGNSLVGTSTSDFIGTRLRALQNGNYLTASGSWNNPTTVANKAGAVSLGNGNTGSTGPVSSANSLVGLNSNDQIGGGVREGSALINGIRGLSDDNLLVVSADWSNGAVTAAGAITLGSGRYRLTGNVAAYNSVRSALANEGTQMPFDYDPTQQQLVVGLPMENKVALFRMDQIFADGFE